MLAEETSCHWVVPRHKCVLNRTLGQSVLPIEYPTLANGAMVDLRAEALSRDPRDSKEEEVLPKVIGPSA